MTKLTHLCFALICGLLAVSAQRPARILQSAPVETVAAQPTAVQAGNVAGVPVEAAAVEAVNIATVPIEAVAAQPVAAQPVAAQPVAAQPVAVEAANVEAAPVEAAPVEAANIAAVPVQDVAATNQTAAVIPVVPVAAINNTTAAPAAPPSPTQGPYGIAAIGDGPAQPSANPNISVINGPSNTTGPSTITDAANTTSPFTLAQLRALELANTGSNYPTQNYTLFLADIHFVSGNLSSQYIAYHYCHFVSADFMQCALYNSRDVNARLIGNEYFITQAIFNTLPYSERNLWHSHPFEIQTGLFVAPDLSTAEELEVMQWLMGTFGKVTDTWQYYEEFPLGAPQNGFALALVSQVNWTLAAEMDQLLNLSTTYLERQQQRAGLVTPPRTPGAENYIFTGYAVQYEIYSFPLENNGTVLGAANATGPALVNQTAPVTGNITLPASANITALLPTGAEAAPGSTDSLPNPKIPNTIGAAA